MYQLVFSLSSLFVGFVKLAGQYLVYFSLYFIYQPLPGSTVVWLCAWKTRDWNATCFIYYIQQMPVGSCILMNHGSEWFPRCVCVCRSRALDKMTLQQPHPHRVVNLQSRWHSQAHMLLNRVSDYLVSQLRFSYNSELIGYKIKSNTLIWTIDHS